MQQFSLDIWLQDKSRKVVTRRGNPVRIICADRKHGEDDLPIVFLEENNGGEFLLTCRNDGKGNDYDTQYDLFFADEEEELTEFEKEVQKLFLDYGCNNVSSEEYVKNHAKELLNLARQQLQPEIDEELDKAYRNQDDVIYRRGKEDALKDLPKWKKATEHKKFGYYLIVLDASLSLCVNAEVFDGDYYIELKDLKTLPKEE